VESGRQPGTDLEATKVEGGKCVPEAVVAYAPMNEPAHAGWKEEVQRSARFSGV
jgi:hypothetical protein